MINFFRRLVFKFLYFSLSILNFLIGKKVVDRFLFVYFSYKWHFLSKRYELKRSRKDKPALLWCPVNIINHKYWSESLKEIGYHSITVADNINFIAGIDAYDFFTDEYNKNFYHKIANNWEHLLLDCDTVLPNFKHYIAFEYVLKNFDIVHTSFLGTFLKDTPFWDKESLFFKKFGIKVIILPFGGDMFKMSQITDTILRHTYISHNLHLAKDEKKIWERIDLWAENADSIISGLATDGMGVWSAIPCNTIVIDTILWKEKSNYTKNDGTNGKVRVVHTPNHRYMKGTEYLIKAVEELRKEEKLDIDLILIEKTANSEVKRIMQEEADILAEQFVFNMYALSGIEGMSSGLPVMANLSNPHYTRLFRLHSYLNECPVLSTAIEEIKNNLRILVTNPQLRETLGRAGRAYVEKYHSYQSSQYMFEKIYDKIWYGKEVDLMNMYHPLNPEAYNHTIPMIQHPLVENKIPESLLKQLNT